MRKRIIWINCISAGAVLLLLGAFLLSYFVFQVPLFSREGWQQNPDGTVAYLDYYGDPLEGWQTVQDKRYYFTPNTGTMHVGWLEDEGHTYYLDADGTMHTGWLTTEEGRYYLTEEGQLYTGWMETESGKFFFGENGAMVTDWQTLEEKRYYFSENGVMHTGWLKTEEGSYFLCEDGQPRIGWMETGEGAYYFAEDGKMVTGWADTDRGHLFFGEDGIQIVGWVEEDGNQYYMNADGERLTGWQELDGKSYYFDDAGIRLTGWVRTQTGRYYLYEDGGKATGWVEIGGTKRYFLSTGEYIALVNPWNKVPADYETKLVYLEGYRVDITCRSALSKMLNACRSAGYACELNSAYRDINYQQKLWDNRYNNYIKAGKTPEEATKLTGQVVAIPGTSEHHLGLAVDITGTQGMYNWLAKHSWEYGFILRYPADKIHVTGIIYEPWHFRYVGKEMAKDIYQSGLTLEEYLEAQ